MIKFHWNLLGILACSVIFMNCGHKDALTDYTQWVNPFIGTLHEGHCSPGATVPFGMVQPGPESHTAHFKGYEMDHVVGYQYTDSLLKGFTQTHLNGVGCPAMSDILLMPFSREVIDKNNAEAYYSDYDKSSERSVPGYYSVCMKKNNVKVDITASEHVAYYQYTFGSDIAKVLFDSQYGVNWNVNELDKLVVEATESFEDEYTISGYRKVHDWTVRKVFYTIKFNKPILTYNLLQAKKSEQGNRYILNFDMQGDSVLQAKIALSTTGIDGAKKNMLTEIPAWNCFDDIRKRALSKWNTMLANVKVSGNNEQMTAFYTSLYHLYIQPNNIADVDGSYRAENDSVYRSKDGRFYSTFSLWDTFRAVHPMYTLLIPDSVGGFVNSMMEAYTHKPVDVANESESNKYLPRWSLWGRETNTMVANHAVPVIVEAYLKGLLSDEYSLDEIYDAVKKTVTLPHYRNHVRLIDKYGYIPYDVKINTFDDNRETVSRLLEGIYDDYCAGLMASKMGDDSLANRLLVRAGFYRNVYDEESGFMCGRNAAGKFKKENPTEVVGEWLEQSSYTEGNSWHYLFHVLHDVPGMIELMGGQEAFSHKLDSMFYSDKNPEVKTLIWNIMGMLGQYWHGNEPCHHVPYLYKFTDKGYKTDAITHYLTTEFYKNTPDGLKGNDDCGQMSAWYMFASMGLYPIDPVSGQFIVSAPQFDNISLSVSDNKKFIITVERQNADCIFVKEVYLNGKLLDRPYITYDEIMSGGKMRVLMYSRSDKDELIKFNVK